MKEHAQIGHFNLAKGYVKILLDKKSSIGNFNSFHAKKHKSKCYCLPHLRLHQGAKIMGHHYLDLLQSINIGERSILAGAFTQCWTHSYIYGKEKHVELGGTKLLDGGMADSIPLEAFNNMGYKRNIVILTQPSDYAKHPSRLNKAFDIFMHGYPQVYQLMKNRYKMYNGQLEYVRRQEACGSALVICPAAPLEISRTSSDKKQMQAVYDQGRAAGVANIEKIKEFLSFS